MHVTLRKEKIFNTQILLKPCLSFGNDNKELEDNQLTMNDVNDICIKTRLLKYSICKCQLMKYSIGK